MWSAIIPYGEINFAEIIIAPAPVRQSPVRRKPSLSFGTAAPAEDREGYLLEDALRGIW